MRGTCRGGGAGCRSSWRTETPADTGQERAGHSVSKRICMALGVADVQAALPACRYRFLQQSITPQCKAMLQQADNELKQ